MPVIHDDNTAARITAFDDKAIAFYSYSLNKTSDAQSLASLMNCLSKKGYHVHHITYEQPAGDDYITGDDVERHVLCKLENDGMASSVAFLRILGRIPCKTVVLWGKCTKRMYQCYLAAKSLGRCVIFYQTTAPTYCLANSSQNMTAIFNNIVCGSDCVVTPCDYDEKVYRGFGAPDCKVIPFFFPYDESEVSPSKLEGNNIAYFTHYLGKNTKNAVAAFAMLHEKHPETTMHITLMPPIAINDASDAMMKYIQESNLSDSILIERKVLKPLRALRDACMAITYPNLDFMPQTAVEAVTAGIPSVLCLDADYSGSSVPSECVPADDTFALYELMEKYFDFSEREKYREKARKNLTSDVREEIVTLWENVIDSTEKAFDERVASVDAEISKVCSALTSGDIEKSIEKIRGLMLEGVSGESIFGAMVYSGFSKDKILEYYGKLGLFAGNDVGDINLRFRFINVIEKDIRKGKTCEQALLNIKKGIYSGIGIEAMLSMSGVKPAEIKKLLGFADDRYMRYAYSYSFRLLNSMYHNDVMSDRHIYDHPDETSYYAMRTADQRFIAANRTAIKYKTHFFVRRAIRFHDWITKPWDFKSFPEKLITWPAFLRTYINRKLLLIGKKRQNKRKVVEVASSDTRKIQILVMMLLLELDRICKKYDLTYYIAGGSILGAVRHKGFIPWDDDIDITMPRPDYDKFIKVAQKELPEEYYLDKDCVPFCHNRIEIRGTDFTTFWRKGAVFLDILALEGSPENEEEWHKHERKCKFWRSCMLEKARPFPLWDFSSKAKIKRYICCSILRFVPRWFIKKNWERCAKKYDANKCDHWVCLPASIYTYEQERFPREYWGKPVYLEFEGMQLPTMSHWEDYLVCHFGDYMKMPPETTRKSHHYIFSYTLGKYGEMPIEEMEKMFLEKKKEHFGE